MRQQLNDDIASGKYPLFSRLPTEMDLAALYGVSRSTVRQALCLLEKDGIIEKKWGSGNTVISTGAASLKDTVALILPSEDEHRFEAVRNDCMALLLREGLGLRVFSTGGSLSEERRALSAILADSFAGVIAEPVKSALPSTNLDLYRQLLRRRTPLVFIYSSPDESLPSVSVTADDISAGYLMTRHLINKGHRAIGGMFRFDELPGIRRYQGYAEALRDAGLAMPEASVYWYPANAALAAGASVTDGPPTAGEAPGGHSGYLLNDNIRNVTGLVCCRDKTAYHVIEALQRQGLDVPGDIAVTGMDDDYYATASTPGITTLMLTRSIGREAANLLILQKRGGSPKSVKIPVKLIQRDST